MARPECVPMSYRVDIRRNSDGVIRRYERPLEWADHSVFFWTEGNGACDCNLHQFFEEAGGRDDAYDDDFPCGDSAYCPMAAILADGTVIQLADA